jgi:hypothetical protein
MADPAIENVRKSEGRIDSERSESEFSEHA